MCKRLRVVEKIFLIIIGIFACIFFGGKCNVRAAEIMYYVSGKSYELEDNSGYAITGTSKEILCFGEKSVGKVTVMGNITDISTYGDYVAYGATDEIALSYYYDGSYQTKDKDAWNLTESDEKTVNGISLDKKVDKGAIIVQKSANGKDWEIVHSETDLLDKKTSNSIWTITDEDIKSGTYYRIIVAYRMTQQTGVEKKLIFSSDTYRYKEVVETYEFYVCYGGNPVVYRDISTGNEAGVSVSKGFIIDKCGTDCVVTVSKNNGLPRSVHSLTSITDKGKYKITVTNDLKQAFEKDITVTEGMGVTQITPKVYEGGKKGKYEVTNAASNSASFGMQSLTNIKLGCEENSRIATAEKNGFDAYGITGSTVSIYLRLADMQELIENGWEVCADDYGKKEKDTILGIQTGEIATGALIVQKSTDGTVLENINQGKYANGIYTTDFYNYYSNKGDICIYSPDGNDVLNGVYLRVIYAYKLKATESKEYNRCLEVYEFYLCSNELGAVTFHNLSVTEEMIKEAIGEDNADWLELYKNAESLVSGSGTVTGFSVDTKGNPTVTYSVKRNGKDIAIPTNQKFIEDGKYEIELKSAVGDTETVIIYVDKSSLEEALDTYFGDGFINGKRIFKEGNYPVYEGGKTNYSIQKVSEEYLPIGGTIVNTATGEMFEIPMSREAVSEEIKTPGDYVVTLSTAPMQDGNELSGDWRVFTFNFSVIAEGTAPGPIVNQNSLKDYSKTTMSDSYPMYYGLTYGSALGGDITLAFSTKEAAKQYAYNYEKGTVEKQSDGTYRYTGSCIMRQKVKYVSAWDLTDAMHQFAEQAVQTLYFDMSDPFTYCTLPPSIASIKNPRTLELNSNVILFAEGERENLCEKVDSLPIINTKVGYYLSAGKMGKNYTDDIDFEFEKDKYGVDSNKVIITDCNGKDYQIQYGIGVGLQLMQQNCPTGIVTITETTCYGDSNSYQAVYFAENENTATLGIIYYDGKTEKRESFSQKDDEKTIEVDAFKIAELTDELDPYSIVKIEEVGNLQNTIYYVADQVATHVWSEPGKYRISVINRMGYHYSINVKIAESEYVTISFTGDETDELEAILTSVGEKNIKLPELSRYGYELVGFETENGTLYIDEIPSITNKSEMVLNAVWKAKEYTLTLQDKVGNVYKTMGVEFGRNYMLESPEVPVNTTFAGWIRNDEVIKEDRIAIDKEEDIVLTACFVDGDGKKVDISIDEQEEQSAILWVWIIILLFIAIAIYLIIRKRFMNGDNMSEMMTDEVEKDEQIK